jgi:RHS repeat-associated protein
LSRARIRKEYYWYTDYEVWALSGEVRYLYDGRRVIQERNSGNTPTVTYTRGPDLSGSFEGAGGIGGLLARSHGYSGSTGAWSTHHYYHADGGGNITAMADNHATTAALSASYRYDPFGRTLSQSGTMAAANLYRFSSKEIHAQSGMYGYGFRFYDPTLQRWLNRRSWSDHSNLLIGSGMTSIQPSKPGTWLDFGPCFSSLVARDGWIRQVNRPNGQQMPPRPSRTTEGSVVEAADRVTDSWFDKPGTQGILLRRSWKAGRPDRR